MEARRARAVLRHPRVPDIMTTASTIASEALVSASSRASTSQTELALHPMQEANIGQAVSLISRAMNPEEGGYAAQTLHLHFSSRKNGVDDGRILYILTRCMKIVGVVGLHHYAWGPPENVWLSWFALDPQLQGQGLAGRMLGAVMDQARQHRFMKLFIETYSTPEFARARSFYRAQGFKQVGRIPCWLPDGGAMVVLYKDLSPCP